jgi:hypothetical protein
MQTTFYLTLPKPANGPDQAFASAMLPAFAQRLAVLADADWRAVVGARDMFANLSPGHKQAINRLCQAGSPSAAELMAALIAAIHSH